MIEFEFSNALIRMHPNLPVVVKVNVDKFFDKIVVVVHKMSFLLVVQIRPIVPVFCQRFSNMNELPFCHSLGE